MDKNRKKIRWFKAEVRAMLNRSPHEEVLRNRITVMENKFNAHSPSLTDVHYATKSRDEQLAVYADRITKFREDLDRMERQDKMVMEILSLMDEDMSESLLRVLKGKSTLKSESNRYMYTETGLQRAIDSSILMAVRRYEGDS